MSALAFRVHIDKENEAPAAVIGKSAGALKSFGPRQKNFVQPTPRKALFDVNNERQLSSNKFVPGKNVNLKQPIKNQNSMLRIARGVENSHTTKLQSKGALSNITKNKPKAPEIKAPKVKTVVKPKIVPPTQQKHDSLDDEESEGESIFPRSERLSTYVGQLFSWRPPCLFGSIPDSEDSDLSDHDDHDNSILPELLDMIDIPMPEMDVPDMRDILSVMDPLPVPEDHAAESQSPASQLSQDQQRGAGPSELDTLSLPVPSEFDIIPTPDTSLSLGSLHVMTGSLDVSLNGANNLSLHENLDKSDEYCDSHLSS